MVAHATETFLVLCDIQGLKVIVNNLMVAHVHDTQNCNASWLSVTIFVYTSSLCVCVWLVVCVCVCGCVCGYV